MVVDDERLQPVEFARLAEEIFAADGVEETAEQVVALAAAEIEVDHVGLALLRSKRAVETIAATSEIPALVARLRSRGPYRDARWRRQALVVDLRWDQRWPEWAAEAVQHGVRNLLAVELLEDGRRVGVLSIFSSQHRQFSEEDISFAHIFARHAALALQAADRDAYLQVALDGRKLIGQAQGILMERFAMTDAQAFALLRRLSQEQNRKLRDVAREMVRTRRLPG